MAKKVLIHFGKDGAAKIEAQGFEGQTCLAATKPFEDLFNGVDESNRKSEGACAGGETVRAGA